MKNENPSEASHNKPKLRMIIAVFSAIILVILLGSVYLRFVWIRYQHMAESEALQLAQSVRSLLHSEHILNMTPENKTDLDYRLVEQSLVQLVEATDSIYYAYILKYYNSDIIVAVDSSAAKLGTTSPLKHYCSESTEINELPFETGRNIIDGPIFTPCGSWVRTLVPILSADKKSVIAVLGLNYSAAEWQAKLWIKMTPDIIISVCMAIFAFLLFNLWNKHINLKKSTQRLAFQETLYRNVFEQAPIGIYIQEGKEEWKGTKYSSVNSAAESILGRTAEELKSIAWPEFLYEDEHPYAIPQFRRFAKGEINSYSMEQRLIRPDNSVVWVNLKLIDFSAKPLYDSMFLCLMEDITDRKLSEESLYESERSKSVFLSHLPGMAFRCRFDNELTFEYVSEGCYELTGYKAESLVLNREISYNQIISPEYREVVHAERDKALKQHKHYHHEYEIITKSGERKWVLARGRGVYDKNGDAQLLEGIILDISEHKQKDNQIVYLREHDFLTGLYNQNHIEQEQKRLDLPEFLPFSIAVCDIDGLRMVNDAYGYEEGDRLIVKTARLIEGSLSGNYVMGYSGGGGFILLLPNTDDQAAYRLRTDIKNTLDRYNRANANALYTISVTVGYGTKETEDQQIQDVVKIAREHLNSRKLLNQSSSHSAILSSIMVTLYAKSHETEKHGHRLSLICQKIGVKLNLPQKDLDDLQLLSRLHDIGKIGIDDQILNKPGKLNEEEWIIMKQHPEIGHRIAVSTPHLEHIAEYILHHHERWDGNGYPVGLKGEEIPLLSRILSIADSFDAMTEDRVYRKALSVETALQEIKQNAGTQFDPNIAKLFIELIEANENSVLSSI